MQAKENQQWLTAGDKPIIIHRWKLESTYPLNSPASMIMKYMEDCVKITTPHYSCNRPPGAAGAFLVCADLVVVGYVEPPMHSPSCKDVGCEMVNGHCERTIHAEVQAICTAAMYGLVTDGATLYSILKPCYNCSKIIIQAGIKHIYYAGAAYREDRTYEILDIAGVSCDYVDINLPYGEVWA